MRTEKLDLCKMCGKMFLKTRDTNVCPVCAPQKYSPEFTAQSESRLAQLTKDKNEESIKKNTDEQKDRKWSRKFDCCVKCGRNDVRHRARGLCFSCYERESGTKNRGQVRGKYGSASRKLNYEYLYKEYITKMRSLGDIAKESSCTRQYILRLLKKYGIERRTQSEARIEAMKKGKFEKFGYYEINENFFAKWSPKMAWVLGLLFTDVFIRPFSIAIWSMDREILEKIKNALGSTNPIGITPQSYDKSKHIHTFAFYREKLMEDLNKLGLHRRKSLNMMFPKVPEEYVRHFIRGCWDGDGSIFYERSKLVGSYISGSKKFIETLVQELYKIGISKSGVSYRLEKSGKRVSMPVTKEMLLNHPDGRFPLTIHMKNINAFYIKIQTRKNVEKLFHYFYDGVDESMYLSRKYNVFVEGLESEKKGKPEQLALDLDS